MGLLNFYETPRFFGNPFQILVAEKEDAFQFVRNNLGKKPIYTSVYSFPTFNEEGNPFQVKINKLFSDFDSERKPENALLDVRKIDDFFTSENIESIQAFSGGKGFHNYTLLDSETYVLSPYLSDVIRAINIWITNKLNLRTLDIRCAEPRRLCRLWYTPYASRNKKTGKITKNGNYCFPLTKEQLHELNINEIIEFSKNPLKINPNNFKNINNPNRINIMDFIEYFEIDINKTLKDSIKIDKSYSNKIIEYKEVEDEFIKRILPRPCIHMQIVHNPNPPHIVRFGACIQLKDLGFDPKWIFDFFQNRGYIDSHNTSECAYQINQIFRKNPPYKHPSCSTLKKNGVCVGERCKRYNKNIY